MAKKTYNFEAFDEGLKEFSQNEKKDYNFDAFDESVKEYSPEEISKTEAALRGGAQGASFGFSDEITALLESAATDKDYKTALEESRKAYKAAEEAHPGTTLAGNVVGGLLVPVPGVGAAVGAGKGLVGVGKMAAAGALGGALAGAGTTESDLLSQEGLKDVAGSAALGGVIAPVVGKAIPSGAKMAKDWWLEQRAGRDISEIFKKGMEKPGFGTLESFKNVGKELDKQIEEDVIGLTEKALPAKIQQEYTDALRNATGTVSIEDIRQPVKTILEESTTQGTQTFDQGAKEIDLILNKITRTKPTELLKYTDVAGAEQKALQKVSDKLDKVALTSETEIANLAEKEASKLVQDLDLPTDKKEEIRQTLFNALKKSYDKTKGSPSVRTEKAPLSGKDVLVGEITTPVGKTKASLADIVPEEKALTVDMMQKPDLDANDLKVLRDEGEYLFKKYGTKESPNFDRNVAKAGLEMKDKAKQALNTMSEGKLANADELNAALSDIKGILNIDLPSPNDRVAFARGMEETQKSLKETFVRQYKNFDSDEQRRIEKAVGKLVDSKLMPKEQAENLFKSINKKAYERYLLANMHDISELATDMWNFFGVPLNARGKAYQASAFAGSVVGKATSGGKKVVDWTKNIYNKSPEELQMLAVGLGKLGNPLAQTILKASQQPEAKRRALLFTLMQQPAFRETVDTLAETFSGEE